MSAEDRVQPLRGCGAVRVGHDVRAFEHIRLLRIVLGHAHAARGKALVEVSDDIRIAPDVDTHGLRHGLARQIVLRRSQAAHDDHDIHALRGDAHGADEMLHAIADRGLEGDLHADLIQALGDEKGVGVLAKGRQHLRADGDGFCEHAGESPSEIQRYKSVQIWVGCGALRNCQRNRRPSTPNATS